MTPEDEFRCFARGYWNEARSGHEARAALNTEALEQLVALWQAAGAAAGRLSALLSDPSAEVRYFAAALLGPAEGSAVACLDALAREPAAGPSADAARGLLRQWRRKVIPLRPVGP